MVLSRWEGLRELAASSFGLLRKPVARNPKPSILPFADGRRDPKTGFRV